ncbi:rho GTPase-activating protein 11A isoform X2 [Triplophysa dalaica]|uniref:rho GTPase-activating protein 11A isoform X2 n=1 Tax=Triplophysa dalaica TaxID=1582913 RepID=UPI0024DF9D63|nr:rho GTPase-activating protein 11A isoform X2 [Triplophysa dalaica]
MRVLERNVVRLAVVQHLRSVYGIKIKNWNKNRNKQTSANSVRVFGAPLESLPHCHVLDYGDLPCFIADVCTSLMDHLDTEGLFRKSGSVVRVKSLRSKLDQGEDCLSTAVPLDIAGLLKQFFRELPEPVLTADLHSAFLKVQELPTEEERTSGTLLLTCVLPEKNLNTLRYFFSFLRSVSLRCAQNKMDSSNLSVIFAPNLFHCGDGVEKMNSSTEKRLKHQAAAVQCLIDNAAALGVVPQFLMEKVPAMLGCDAGMFSPSSVSLEENNTHSDMKKNNRRSLGVFSSATPVIMTPNSKRKLPQESHTHGFSNKKRRSIKKNLGLELLPNALFGGTSTPGSAHSASGVLDLSQNALLSSVGRNTRSSRRKSNRLRGRSVSRVESGKTGCFSPRCAKKEPLRKSLRLRFSLGKSSRESNNITHSQLGPKRSEVIGWRLATQESCSGFHFTKESAFSPAVLTESPSKGKLISKSENNLLTPDHMSLWSEETPHVTSTLPTNLFSNTPMSIFRSVPAITVSETQTVSNTPESLCCVDSFSDERSHTGYKPAQCEEPQDDVFRNSEVVSSHADVPSDKLSESSGVFESNTTDDCNVTFGQIEFVPLSPLHIDSTLFETGLAAENMRDGSLCFEDESKCYLKEPVMRSQDCSQLIDALDIQSPVPFRRDTSIRVQSTPYTSRTQTASQSKDLNASSLSANTDEPQNNTDKPQNSLQTSRMKVSDQIKHFNMMTLNSPKNKMTRSPLMFQRTPVRQSVRRINSLFRDGRTGMVVASPVTKAVSFESGLYTRAKQQTDDPTFTKPPVPPKKPAARHAAALDDITNRAPKVKSDTLSANKNTASEYPKSVCLHVAESDGTRYRGSPRNPLSEGRLLAATKPIDL